MSGLANDDHICLSTGQMYLLSLTGPRLQSAFAFAPRLFTSNAGPAAGGPGNSSLIAFRRFHGRLFTGMLDNHHLVRVPADLGRDLFDGGEHRELLFFLQHALPAAERAADRPGESRRK